jgi:hypothetical protein
MCSEQIRERLCFFFAELREFGGYVCDWAVVLAKFFTSATWANACGITLFG